MEISPHAETDDFLSDAPKDFQWQQYPEADKVLREKVGEFLQEHLFAADLAKRMHEETGTDFFDWVDHMFIPSGQDIATMRNRNNLVRTLETQGFTHETALGQARLHHPHADFPIVCTTDSHTLRIGIGVESVEDFLQKHHLNAPIFGNPFNPLRCAFIPYGNMNLVIVERHNEKVEAPRIDEETIIEGYGLWDSREREPDPGQEHNYMQKTLDCAKELVQLVGGRAADTVLDCERNYWMYTKENTAGALMKDRLDALGLGWGKIRDHHTFRSSREHFATLVQIFLTLGFKKRERYYAGDAHGWGAQVMEHPETGDVLFLDVDLFPDEAQIDFSREPLHSRGQFNTVGRWCALHGESILNAGMHHLEAKFDFDKVRSILEKEKIQTMPPFSDFPYLRQAFTEGEQWYLDDVRLDHALRIGAINQETYNHIVANDFSAIGSHLENLQRRNGYKGFNKKGVDAILAAVDPQRIAVQQKIEAVVNDK
ncbi:hypothetical protein A2635_01905 [Candidatus Peribacteria bacterium RIFCSPHIGHO2_01_FULL_51_9]|nr:MAG: hypothetical protein A2635_01905 [Candidatus Peribacteria bacterium RIFCSPHIGHO2_01_FULL_51_9]